MLKGKRNKRRFRVGCLAQRRKAGLAAKVALLFMGLSLSAQTLHTINLGTTANDGTGDTLRRMGQKVNSNFIAVANGTALTNINASGISGIVAVANGGTGNTSNAAATAVLAGAVSGVLTNSITGNAATATTTTNLAGILPIANGGTGNPTNRAATAVLASFVSGMLSNSISGNAATATIASNLTGTISSEDPGTNNAVTVLRLNRGTTGTAADNFAMRIVMGLEADNGTTYEAGVIETLWADAHLATGLDSDIRFLGFRGGSGEQEVMRLQGLTGNVGIGTTNPTSLLAVAGTVSADSIYLTNNCSALTFTDRSDAPADLAAASRMIAAFAVTGGQVDHAKLDPDLWGKKVVYVDTGAKRTIPGTTNLVAVNEPVLVPDQSKRNLSMMVSALALDNQSKQKQIDALVERVTALEKR